jgi:hypothetical protein
VFFQLSPLMDFRKSINIPSFSMISMPIPFFIEGMGVLVVLLTIPLSKETLLSGMKILISIGLLAEQPRLVLIKRPLSEKSLDMPVKLSLLIMNFIVSLLMNLGCLLLFTLMYLSNRFTYNICNMYANHDNARNRFQNKAFQIVRLSSVSHFHKNHSQYENMRK